MITTTLTPIMLARYLRWVTSERTEACEAIRAYGLDESDAEALEAALVGIGAMVLDTFTGQPRYIMTDDGWVFYVLCRTSPMVFPTAQSLKLRIPEGIYAGEATTVFNSLTRLVANGAASYTQGSGWTLATT